MEVYVTSVEFVKNHLILLFMVAELMLGILGQIVLYQ